MSKKIKMKRRTFVRYVSLSTKSILTKHAPGSARDKMMKSYRYAEKRKTRKTRKTTNTTTVTISKRTGLVNVIIRSHVFFI